ncbi:MAG: hypothetical protein ACTSUK_02780 [Promethearchaeota archaeon]
MNEKESIIDKYLDQATENVDINLETVVIRPGYFLKKIMPFLISIKIDLEIDSHGNIEQTCNRLETKCPLCGHGFIEIFFRDDGVYDCTGKNEINPVIPSICCFCQNILECEICQNFIDLGDGIKCKIPGNWVSRFENGICPDFKSIFIKNEMEE